jgi:DNA-binding NtrC family response regulator/tetratricopeptide (TPR) repeat protein
MEAVREQIRRLLSWQARADSLPPILLEGETGTGKGLLARTLHAAGRRRDGPFVAVNCAAIPETLLEAELFGFERGAFTDARQAKPGLFQAAHGGTIFLDEIALLPASLQAKLLTVLEDRTVRRLGSTRNETVNVWIITATNEDLLAATRARRFREDLYHRLAVLTLVLPPLRERGEDVLVLAEHFLARLCADHGLLRKELSAEARAALLGYPWPGNVRELSNVLERAALLSEGPLLTPAALQMPRVRAAVPEETPSLQDAVGDVERTLLLEALRETGWNISRAATRLGLSRNTIRYRIDKYGLRQDSPPASPSPGQRPGPPESMASEPASSVQAEGERLKEVLEETGWNISQTAAILGITRNTVRARVTKYGLRPTSAAVPDEMPSGQDAMKVSRGRPAIAVLPFLVEGETEGQGYLGDGIVEDIIGALAGVRDLLVISRNSTLRYRGVRVEVGEVGRDLGVTYALSGSVRRAGQRLRVSAELAETAHGAVVWASHFDGIADDLFALQDQIATRVITTIAPQVREAELRRALRKRPESMEAYDCVLRALAQIYRLNREDFEEARIWLEKAIARDPSYATPYALLAIWHSIRFGQGWSPDPAADQAEVLRLALAALERDSFDAMALALCGHAKSILRYEFDDALALFDRALTISPSSAIAWTRSSPTYSYLGDAREALARAEQGLRLSPFDLHVFYTHTILGLAQYVAGEYEEAVRWCRKAREENPQFTANLRLFAASLAALGQTDEAREAGGALLSVEPRFQVGRFVESYAIRDPERRDRLARQLRSAGLPG